MGIRHSLCLETTDRHGLTRPHGPLSIRDHQCSSVAKTQMEFTFVSFVFSWLHPGLGIRVDNSSHELYNRPWKLSP
jgi:hypothetical protein